MAQHAPKRAAQARPYDVVLYGATGFVGQQTVAYFAQHAHGVRWALAGRSASKLKALRQACGAAQAGVLVADAADAAALDTLAASTRVVLSTVGPFALYGSELVAACVRQRTHYVDITGETPWVRQMIDAHHAQAARNGTRIVPGCGFDSVPSDLGAWLVAQALWREHGERCVAVKASFAIRGGLNGGTFASLMNAMASGQKKLVDNPFLLNPAGTAPADLADNTAKYADPVAPTRDADFNAWVGPFFMGPINTRVVRRSAALMSAPRPAEAGRPPRGSRKVAEPHFLESAPRPAEAGRPPRGSRKVAEPHFLESAHAADSPYAPGFAYQEYMRFGRGAAGALAAAAASVAMASGQGAMAYQPVRRLAARFAPGPGEGPSQKAMDGGSFRCELVGTGERGTLLRGRLADRGDPGNRATTKFVCEAALALVLDTNALPGGAHLGGVLTPATALGNVLARRLRAAGMTVEPLV